MSSFQMLFYLKGQFPPKLSHNFVPKLYDFISAMKLKRLYSMQYQWTGKLNQVTKLSYSFRRLCIQCTSHMIYFMVLQGTFLAFLEPDSTHQNLKKCSMNILPNIIFCVPRKNKLNRFKKFIEKFHFLFLDELFLSILCPGMAVC